MAPCGTPAISTSGPRNERWCVAVRPERRAGQCRVTQGRERASAERTPAAQPDNAAAAASACGSSPRRRVGIFVQYTSYLCACPLSHLFINSPFPIQSLPAFSHPPEACSALLCATERCYDPLHHRHIPRCLVLPATEDLLLELSSLYVPSSFLFLDIHPRCVGRRLFSIVTV